MSIRGGKQFCTRTFFLPEMEKNYLQCSVVAARLVQHTATWWDLLLFVASSVCWDGSRTTCQLMV